MVNIVRKEIEITEEQDELLKRQAEMLGITEEELICLRIQSIGSVAVQDLEEEAAWGRILGFMEERGRIPSVGIQRTWRRDDAYEERDSRWSS